MSGETLRVRVYNVRFGDAILVTVPDRGADGVTTTRRILIDVGNAPLVASAAGGDDSVFGPVLDDILGQLDGHPLDLYVMTHEHLDHTQGLPHAAWKVLGAKKFAKKFAVDHVWMTASADPDYAKSFPNTKKQIDAHHAQLHAIAAYLGAAGAGTALASYLTNNDSTKTSQCVTFLRELNKPNTHFMYRGAPLAGTHPFHEATLEIWGPEQDASEYYGRLKPLALGVSAAAATAAAASAAAAKPPKSGKAVKPALPVPVALPEPPRGVDLGSFLHLLETRRSGVVDTVLAIDKAANNTSLVFMLAWRGWKLLFPGDAEKKSWQMMARAYPKVLQPVHFLKVAHHGSHNGTPDDSILEEFLPLHPPDARQRHAAISTWTDTYGGIPDPPTNTRLSSRATLHTTLDAPAALYYDVDLPDPAG